METIFRHNDVKTKVDNFENIMKQNKELKTEKIKKATEKIKNRSKCLDEFYNEPAQDNNDTKNLNKIKKKAHRNLRN